MLVLSRKISEGIWINLKNADGSETKVLVRVVDILSGRKVRLGLEAPDNVSILREELMDKKKVPV